MSFYFLFFKYSVENDLMSRSTVLASSLSSGFALGPWKRDFGELCVIVNLFIVIRAFICVWMRQITLIALFNIISNRVFVYFCLVMLWCHLGLVIMAARCISAEIPLWSEFVILDALIGTSYFEIIINTMSKNIQLYKTSRYWHREQTPFGWYQKS